MAEEITKHTGKDVELISGNRGEFSVWLGDDLIVQKTGEDFPSPADATRRIQTALNQ